MGRKIAIGLSGFVVIIVVAIVIVAGRAGSLVKAGIDTYGAALMGVPVSVADVNISILDGSATMTGLHVGNPDGFTEGDAFSLKHVAIKLDPMSVFSDHIRIETIRIDEPAISVESRRKLGMNITKIQENLVPAEAEEMPPMTIRISIREFAINGADVTLRAPDYGLDETSLELADIQLTGIGVSEDGIPPDQAVKHIMDVLTPQISAAVAALIGPAAVKGLIGGAGDTGGSVIGKVKSGIGGLFRKKKQEPEEGPLK